MPITTSHFNPCDPIIDAVNSDPQNALPLAHQLARAIKPRPTEHDGSLWADQTHTLIAFAITTIAVGDPHCCTLPFLHSILADIHCVLALAMEARDGLTQDSDTPAARRALILELRDIGQMFIHMDNNGTRHFLDIASIAYIHTFPFAASTLIGQICKESQFRFTRKAELRTWSRLITALDQSALPVFQWAAQKQLQ